MSPSIEVAIPCFNEAGVVGKVIRDVRRVLPAAQIIVYDNCSTDGTSDMARAAGAEVRNVSRVGKGFVLQAIFERSKADIVLVLDGDDTYEAADAPLLLEPLLRDEADMVIGTRLEHARTPFRRFHRLGNHLITGILNMSFGTSFRDILSGYRAFNRRFLNHIPLITGGFETETELVIQSLELGFSVREVSIRYRGRPAGSNSKLRTFRDGYRILLTILMLLRDHRPLLVFGVGSGVLAGFGALLWGLGIMGTTGLRAAGVAFLAAALAVFLAGLVLNTINARFREVQSLLRRLQGAPRESAASESSAPIEKVGEDALEESKPF